MLQHNITWNEAYSLGHDKIDNEHQKLFTLANDIYSCEENMDELKKIIKELIKYTKFHFTNEENFMRDINYVEFIEHKELHEDIIFQLNNIIVTLELFTIKEIKETLKGFILDNIVGHILINDKKVHHFRRNKNELRDMFKWKDSFKVNISLIDKEHQKLFLIAQKALGYSGQNKKLHVKNTIVELYDYMKYHFEHEEKYMEEINYPLISEHKKLHQTIIDEMNLFIKNLIGLDIDTFERKLIEYMDIWLVNHIIYEDHKILIYSQAQA